MKILSCPLNGPRNIAEFIYGGQVKEMPDPAQATDQQWAHYVFYEAFPYRRRPRMVDACTE